MALTRPFINSVPAFNANDGFNWSINVLGGDSIRGYSFQLFSELNTTIPFYSSEIIPVSNDLESETIRMFNIYIPPNASGTVEGEVITLTNNNQYSIVGITYDENNNSLSSQPVIITCYETPSISLKYESFSTGSSEFLPLEDGTILNSTNPTIKVLFSPNDLSSIAKPNSLNLVLYGIDFNGNKNLINNIENIYNFSYSISDNIYSKETIVKGFSINVDSNGNIISIEDSKKYLSFTLEYNIRTIENMTLSGKVENLLCYYSQLSNSPLLRLNNFCQKGVIEINCELTSFLGTSNPIELSYIGGEEVDLTQNGYWAQWSKYFTMQEPYTFRLWARKLNLGTIAYMTSTIYSGRYIKLSYNLDNEGYFISLESGRENNFGQKMYPYYIESERISQNLINDNTKLFIGIQQQDGLFDIDFEIIN